MADKYRKKPVEIEAIQWDGTLLELTGFAGDAVLVTNGCVYIRTLEGDMRLSKGDYVIKGINGEFYPCKPDIFQKTYEKVEMEKMKWKYEKLKGDMAVYAFCPSCNFSYNPSAYDPESGETTIQNTYTFCPLCGEFLYDENTEVNVVWNERSISDYYKGKIDFDLVHRIRSERLGEPNEP